MEQLKNKINEDGHIIGDSIVKVDSFLNHQLDIQLFEAMGQEFYQHFVHKKVDKIVTCEASGIAIAAITAHFFGCNVVFAKKEVSHTMTNDYYTAPVYSYTKQKESIFRIDRRFIQPDENILIIDDFLANGEATSGLISIVTQAQANVVGIGIAIEKGFQPGGRSLREKGYDVKSLVIIDQIKENQINFR